MTGRAQTGGVKYVSSRRIAPLVLFGSVKIVVRIKAHGVVAGNVSRGKKGKKKRVGHIKDGCNLRWGKMGGLDKEVSEV